MVRNYKRKTPGPRYTKEDIENAIQMIKVEKWSFRKASSQYNVPLGTLSSHVLYSIKPNVGHPPALSTAEEQDLVNLIITLQDWGQLSCCNDILTYANEYINLMDLKYKFVDGVASNDWYYGFLKRWDERLKRMHSIPLEKARAEGVTEEIVDGWFKVLRNVLEKLNLFDKPQNIFNMDESGFSEEAGHRVVVVKRGTKYANQVQSNGGKSYTTVLLTIAANGLCLPPYIIYKALRLYSEWCPKNVMRGVVYNGTKSGWSDEHCFYDYLEKLFIPNTKHLKRPLLLIFDGHYSHLCIKSVRLAIKNDIHLLCLPSHSTHILQPLDVYTLKYVKQQWKQLLWERNKSTTTTMDKRDFVVLFSKLFDFALIPAHCSTAFAKSGIYPYDPRTIKNDRIIKNISSRTTPSQQLDSTATPSQQASSTLSVVVGMSSNSDDTLTINTKTVTRSSSAPNLQDVRISATAPANESNYVAVDVDLVNDATDVAYGLLDNALEISNITGSTSPNNENLYNTTTITTSPTGSLRSTSSNEPSNSTLSTVASTDADRGKSLSVIDAIVSKYLSPKDSTKTKKRLIKRPYGVSVTDLDVVGDDIIDKQKKNRKKVVKKKSTTEGENKVSKRSSTKNKFHQQQQTSRTLLILHNHCIA